MLDGSQRALEDDGAVEDDGAPEDEAAGAPEDEGAGAPEDDGAGAPEDNGADAAGGAALAIGEGAAGPPNRLVPPLQLDTTSATASRAAIGITSRQRIWISPWPAHG